VIAARLAEKKPAADGEPVTLADAGGERCPADGTCG
jgi:hypothetical protein